MGRRGGGGTYHRSRQFGGSARASGVVGARPGGGAAGPAAWEAGRKGLLHGGGRKACCMAAGGRGLPRTAGRKGLLRRGRGRASHGGGEGPAAWGRAEGPVHGGGADPGAGRGRDGGGTGGCVGRRDNSCVSVRICGGAATVLACMTVRSSRPSWRAIPQGSPRRTTGTRHRCTASAGRCCASPPTPPTPCRTRSYRGAQAGRAARPGAAAVLAVRGGPERVLPQAAPRQPARVHRGGAGRDR